MAMQEASEGERSLADAIARPDLSKSDILRRIRDLPVNERFVMKDTWRKFTLDNSLPAWRRLVSYKLFLCRCLTFPCNRDYFISEAIVSLGIDEGLIVNMTKGAALPVERKENDIVFMINLPIRTSVGPAGLYFTVQRATNMVEQVEVYPDIEETHWLESDE